MIDPHINDDPVLSEFIELVSDVASDFVPHAEFPTFRVPRLHTPLDSLSNHIGLDPANLPDAINTPLFFMDWSGLPGCSSTWSLHALTTPAGRVYWVDDMDGRHIVAVGKLDPEMDKQFAKVLFASNGRAFKTGIIDSPPSRISTTLGPKEFLIDIFISAFNQSANAWDSLDEHFVSSDEDSDDDDVDPVLWDEVAAEVDARRGPARTWIQGWGRKMEIEEEIARRKGSQLPQRDRRRDVEQYFAQVLSIRRVRARKRLNRSARQR